MLLLATTLAACSTALPPSFQDAAMTFPIAATDVQVRLPLPGWTADDARLALLRKTGGEHVLAAGLLGPDGVRVTIVGGPAPGMTGDECRKGALGERLLGMGLATIAGYETAQTIRQLNPPYREFDRHAFLLGAGALTHVQVIALEKEDPEKFGDAGFRAILDGARFAVVRRGTWDDLPPRYLELSHAAAVRADGLEWLRAAAVAPTAGWIEKLVAFEHAQAARSTEPFVMELGAAVRAELAAKPERTRAETIGLLLAEDGLGLVQVRTGDVDAAEPHLLSALELAKHFDARTRGGVLAALACLSAAKKDTDSAVAFLSQANAEDPAVRYRLMREPLLDPVREDPRAVELLKIVLKAPSNKRLGGH